MNFFMCAVHQFDLVRSLMDCICRMHCLQLFFVVLFVRFHNFRQVPPFCNHNESKATGVENRDQISHFLTPPLKNLQEEWAKCPA